MTRDWVSGCWGDGVLGCLKRAGNGGEGMGGWRNEGRCVGGRMGGMRQGYKVKWKVGQVRILAGNRPSGQGFA